MIDDNKYTRSIQKQAKLYWDSKDKFTKNGYHMELGNLGWKELNNKICQTHSET